MASISLSSEDYIPAESSIKIEVGPKNADGQELWKGYESTKTCKVKRV